jgi:hypothetical protein
VRTVQSAIPAHAAHAAADFALAPTKAAAIIAVTTTDAATAAVAAVHRHHGDCRQRAEQREDLHRGVPAMHLVFHLAAVSTDVWRMRQSAPALPVAVYPAAAVAPATGALSAATAHAHTTPTLDPTGATGAALVAAVPAAPEPAAAAAARAAAEDTAHAPTRSAPAVAAAAFAASPSRRL